MRQTKLNQTDSGFTRNLGWKITKSGKRSQPKFYLGNDEREAQKRVARISELWEHIEKKRKEPKWYEYELAFSLLLSTAAAGYGAMSE